MRVSNLVLAARVVLMTLNVTTNAVAAEPPSSPSLAGHVRADVIADQTMIRTASSACSPTTLIPRRNTRSAATRG